MWCRESRDPSCVSNAEPCDLHALDGGDGGEQVSMRLRDQTSGKGRLSLYNNVPVWSLCFSALSSFYNSEDESKLFLPKLPTLPKR